MKKFIGHNRIKYNGIKIIIYTFILIMIFLYIINKIYFKYDNLLLISNDNYYDYIGTIIDPKKVLLPPKIEKSMPVFNENKEIEVYIYNTHQSEAYDDKIYETYNIKPNIISMSYYLQELLKSKGINSIVENRSINDVLEKNDWPYKNSYKVSRMYLEDTILKYPNIKLLIDLHRDSSIREKTTLIYNGKSYAKILFIVGLDNEKYQQNLILATELNNMFKEYSPDFSRGIYKKSGAGVNGIYNQDFSSNTILLELGGQYNYISEAINTLEIFSDIIGKYLHGK